MKQSLVHLYGFCMHVLRGFGLMGADSANVVNLVFGISKCLLQLCDLRLCNAPVYGPASGNVVDGGSGPWAEGYRGRVVWVCSLRQ